MWKIRQHPAGWEVLDPSGAIVDRCEKYGLAVARVSVEVAGALVAAGADASPGLLPEAWEDAGGIAFKEPTGPERDFSDVAWSWRDPQAGIVPLMLQTENDFGHMGAELAGFIEQISETAGTLHARGRFYDTEVGVQFRDMLLDGRTFGVSVDPSENVDAEFVCTEEDEDGFCIAGKLNFLAYEVAGLTGVPFPGFAKAAIQLDPATVGAEPDAVAASAVVEEAERITFSAAVPVAPPSAWFTDPALQGPTPMTVTDSGQIFGHLACWGTCHISYEDVCVTAPASESDYAYFRTGEVRCENGDRVPTGALTMGIGHASLEVSAQSAIAHYDDTTHGVADLASGEDAHGIWIAGAIRPDLSETQLRTLRAASPSGDWRRLAGTLELVAALCVNVPGFPVPRVQARTASGVCTALIAAGPTRAGIGTPDPAVAAMRRQLATIEAAVRPQLRTAADQHLARIRRPFVDDFMAAARAAMIDPRR